MYRNRIFSLKQTLVISAAAIAVLAADQYSKAWIVRVCPPIQELQQSCRVIIPNLLNWTFERNIHGAFGLFGSSSVMLIGMAIVVLVLFWFSFREAAAHSQTVRIAFGMIVGGAIGNVVDRLHYGYVIDFIDFIGFYHVWKNIFNVADSCITAGVGLLLLSSLVARRHG